MDNETLELTAEAQKQVEAINKKFGDMSGDIQSVKEIAEQMQKDRATKEEFSTLTKSVEDLTEELKGTNKNVKALQGGSFPTVQNMTNKVNEWIRDNSSKIKEVYENKSGVIRFTLTPEEEDAAIKMEIQKAVGNMTTGNVTLPSATPAIAAIQAAPPQAVNLQTTFIDQLVNLFPTTLASFPYTESTAGEGAITSVAEEGSKPQIDFDLATRYASAYKVAGHIILSEEVIDDVPNMQNIATRYLRDQHDLKRENLILFGAGTGNDPKGATVYGRSFVAGSMANAVTNPNFMDVVNAAATDIFLTHNFTDEQPYRANLVLIHPVTFFLNLVSAKDGDGKPLYPTATLFNQVSIGGMQIRPFEDVPATKIFVGDMKKYNVSAYKPYSFVIGWINDQLIKNQFTMVGESRFHAFVRNHDEQAFLYDDFATIQAAITA